MVKIGLKLWSENDIFLKEAIRLFNSGIYDYIEIYIVPDSYNKYISLWSQLKIPYIIHAPNYQNGFNLADKNNEDKNLYLFKEVKRYAKTLRAKRIIVHLGVEGDIKETKRQIELIKDCRLIAENNPYFGLEGKICRGANIEEIKDILTSNHIDFCLDIAHVIYAANAQKIKPIDYVKKMIQLKPVIYHLVDGDYYGILDQHLHFGKGNFPLQDIIGLLPNNAMITVETENDLQDNLNDFVKDVKRLKSLKGEINV